MRIVDDVTCELDDVTRARITDLEAKLDELDHYALLDITRDADKKTVKRAYFALASKFHPDRFFGKKLGPVRVPLERIFDRLTTAHDALVREELRAAYDATLPPAPRRASSSKGLVLRPSSRKMKRVTVPPAEVAPTPPPRRASRPVPASPPSTPSPGGLPAAPRPPAGAWPRRLLALSSDRTPPAPDRTPPSPDEALRRMYASAKQGQVQRRVDIFLGAADEALRKDDVIAAANNYRLALQNTENPEVRKKLEAIEALAKSRHYEQSITRARAAEKAERWVDAATYFAKANAARPEASSAERAAHALRLSGGDLHRAAELAQQAILADPKNAGYHVTLGEIFLAAKLFTRAAGEATRALEIAPKDERAKRLAAALPKKKT